MKTTMKQNFSKMRLVPVDDGIRDMSETITQDGVIVPDPRMSNANAAPSSTSQVKISTGRGKSSSVLRGRGRYSGKGIRMNQRPKISKKPKNYRHMLVELIKRLDQANAFSDSNSKEYKNNVRDVFESMDRRIKQWGKRTNFIKLLQASKITKCNVINESLKQY